MTKTEPDEITQAVTALCEAVPGFSVNTTYRHCELGGKQMFTYESLERILPIIAQHAMKWAADSGATYHHDNHNCEMLMCLSFGEVLWTKQTAWLRYDNTTLTSEPIARIRAVTEMAGLMK